MKRALLLSIAIAMGIAAAADAGGKAGTRVTLDHIQVNPGETIYTGDIFSSRRACKNQRRVYVFRAVAGGPDDKIGSTLSYKGKSQPGYFWALEKPPGIPAAGNYYSKVRATQNCKADRSANYQYPQF